MSFKQTIKFHMNTKYINNILNSPLGGLGLWNQYKL